MFCSTADKYCETGASVRVDTGSSVPGTVWERAWRELNLKIEGESMKMKLLAAEMRRTEEPL